MPQSARQRPGLGLVWKETRGRLRMAVIEHLDEAPYGAETAQWLLPLLETHPAGERVTAAKVLQPVLHSVKENIVVHLIPFDGGAIAQSPLVALNERRRGHD